MAPRTQRRKPRLTRMDAAIDAMLRYGFAEKHVRKAVKLLLKEYGGYEGWPFIEEFAYKELIEALLGNLGISDEPEADEQRNPSQGKSCGCEEPPARSPSRASDGQVVEGPQEYIPAVSVAFSGAAAFQDKPRGCEEPPVRASTRASDCQAVEGPQHEVPAGTFPFSGAAAEPTFPGFVSRTPLTDNAVTDGRVPNDILPNRNEESSEEVDYPNFSGIPVSQSVNNSSPMNSRRPLHCYGWIESDDEEEDDDFIALEAASMVFGKLYECAIDGKRKHDSRWDQRPDL